MAVLALSGLLAASGICLPYASADENLSTEGADVGEASDNGESSLITAGQSESGGKLFEDQNSNVQFRDGIPVDGKENGGKDTSKKMIAGYSKVGLVKTITYNEGRKPSYADLKSQFPPAVDVYFVGEKKSVSLPVTWTCVGEDYDKSRETYFIFTPTFDSKYALRDMSRTLESPYIEVKQNPGLAVNMIASAPPAVNEKKVFEFCTKTLKLNKAAACGILANMYCESGFRTNAIGDGNTSVGLCQWHNGRWVSLKNYTTDWQKLEGQLAFMKHELEGGYSKNYDYLKKVSDDAQGAYDAAYFWCMHYEMPDNAESRGITRGYLAKNIYWPRYGEEDSEEDEEGCNDSFAGTYVFDGEGHLNIRKEHSEDSQVIGSIPAGAEVEVKKSNGEWAHVVYQGQKGFCRMEYLTAVKLRESETESGTESSTETEAETDY